MVDNAMVGMNGWKLETEMFQDGMTGGGRRRVHSFGFWILIR